MSKRQRMSFFGTLVLVLLLGLLLTAGTATATTTTVNTTTSAVMGVLDQGTQWEDPVTGDQHADDYVICAVTYKWTGPEGWRLLGYVVVRIDVVMPEKGDNTHVGEVAVLPFLNPDGEDNDPRAWWDDTVTFAENLAGHDLLWTGTWDGYTLNKHNHKVTMVLEGVPGNSVTEDCSAVCEIKNGLYDIANPNAGIYVATPWNALCLVTTP